MTASRHRTALFTGVLTLIVVLVLGPFLLSTDGWIPSHRGGDTARYTAATRAFFVDQVRAGHFPLWNPHVFSGAPFVGVFQSEVFHPFGLLYFVLPLSTSITLDFALNLLLLGVSTFVWLTRRGHSSLGAGFAAFSTVFGAGCFLRVSAGQLTVLGTLALTPLLWLSVEELSKRPSLRWVLIGSGATAIMAFAGHPPTLFMAGAATFAHALPVVCTRVRAVPAGRALIAIGAIPVFGVLLAAVQLLTGLDAAAEGVRQAGGSFDFATTFSMPPESLLTLLVPEAFVALDGRRLLYLGRWFYWDASAFMGLVALLFAIHGAITTRGRPRNAAVALVLVFTVLALGRYTPLYQLLFHVVPGFSFFRAPSKFMFFATLSAAPLVAAGVDRACRSDARVRVTASIAAGIALLLGVATVWALAPGGEPSGAGSLVAWLSWAAHASVPVGPELQRWQSGLPFAFGGFALVGATSAVLLALRTDWRIWPILVLVLVGTAELTVFAMRNRFGTEIPPARATGLAQVYRAAGDDRVLEFPGSNAALYLRGFGVWGYDPVKLDRYAQFVARSQGRERFDLADPGTQIVSRSDPHLAMLRTRFRVRWRELAARVEEPPLPRLLLLAEHVVAEDAGAALDAVFEPGFDPRRTVVLEEPPIPRPGPGPVRGRIRLVAESTDTLDLEGDLERPAILLITDAFAEGWRASALPGSTQATYQLLPADSALRAVPLDAGHHRLRVEYAPAAFRAGARVSAVAWLAWLIAWGLVARAGRRGANAAPSRCGPGRGAPAAASQWRLRWSAAGFRRRIDMTPHPDLHQKPGLSLASLLHRAGNSLVSWAWGARLGASNRADAPNRGVFPVPFQANRESPSRTSSPEAASAAAPPPTRPAPPPSDEES